MASIDLQQQPVALGRRRLLVLLGAAVIAAALNYLVSRGAVALGADPGFRPLTAPVFIPFTLIGIVVGYTGWTTVARRSADPRSVLRRLVPAVLVLSMIPDLLLLATKVIPDTSTTAVLGLMLMHVVVAAVAVPAYQLTKPVVKTS
ncbi:DUF6069 family protein [Kribbella sp. NPDC048928]|uniref:DUF6069 family protein n=1 Tax=Kribbella sp. NPDC048928 TaxID=3364111 RepID=UPI003722F23F